MTDAAQVAAGNTGTRSSQGSGSADVYAQRVAYGTVDPEWDEFVAALGGGFYMQSTCWAALKTAFEWDVVRFVLSRNDRIVGGVQMFLRRLPLGRAIGWCPRGPLLSDSDPVVVEVVLDELHALARRHNVEFLLVQPAQATVLEGLAKRGFRPTKLALVSTATIVVDLEPDLDTILAGMRKKTRQHIRGAARAGVTIRQVGREGLEDFYRLHLDTSRRHAFTPYPERYFQEMWEALRPFGVVHLFLADYEGETVSGLIVLAFGDTVTAYFMAWSGRHERVNANSLLYWAVIEWAKAQGYSACDFAWIDRRAGEAHVAGRPLPDDLRKSTTFFKMGFGQIAVRPGAYEYVHNRVLRGLYYAIAPMMYRWAGLNRTVFRLRWTWLGQVRRRLSAARS